MQLYRQLLALRRDEIVPRLLGTRALGCKVLATGAVSASWQMGDGSVLRIDLNLSEEAVLIEPLGSAELLFDSRGEHHRGSNDGSLGANTALARLASPGAKS